MSRLGKSLITGSELLSLEELVDRVDAVTGDDVAEIAGDLLRLDRLSAAGIGPSEARFKAAVQRVNPALVGRKAA
jgi:predicted Zn-dependent peptidase